MPFPFRSLHSCFILILFALPAAANGAENRVVSAEELERVRARIHALEQKLSREREEKDELRDRLETEERRIAEAELRLRQLDGQIRAQLQQVRQTELQRTGEERRLAGERRALGLQLRASYMIGQRGKTKLLLNQDDARRVGRVLTYYDYLNRRRASRIEALMQQVERLRALEERLHHENRQLQLLRGQHIAALEALQQGRAEYARTLAQLEERIRLDARQLEQLQRSERELVRLLGSLREALADIPSQLGFGRPFAEYRGRLPWPLRGELLATFGTPKAGGFQWNGLWIAAAEGSSVRAVGRGRVAYVGWMHRYGLIIVLEHEGGYYSLYGHNQAVRTRVGEWVNGGDVIAAAGVSGGHEQAGLYFELRKGTRPVDPRLWLAR